VSDRLLWPTLFLLGCYHGINPGMGWLFAVALGFQERRTSAVLRAIVPLALGHVASVALVVLLSVYATIRFPHSAVHWAAGAVLISFGIYRLARARHIRWVGMQVGFWGLVLWAFLMSTAHGAGLMLVPFVTAARVVPDGGMAMPMAGGGHPAYAVGWLMVAVHTLGYLATVTTVALIVYTKVGVRFLRTAWLNVDFVWALALIATGLIALAT
jgi:hypothetical protein